MDDIAEVRAADAIEASAWEDMVACAPGPFRAHTGLVAQRVAGALVIAAPRLPATLFNRAIGVGLEAPARDADLQAVQGVFEAAGATPYWIHANPVAAPDLAARLEARGGKLAARASWAKVVRSTGEIPSLESSLAVRALAPDEPSALSLGPVLTAAHGMPSAMAGWIAALAGRPRWRAYAAFDGDKVVGGGFLYLEGELGWFGLAGTLPSHRRRGVQGALMALRVRAAAEAGATLVATETGEPVQDEANPSLSNMYRAGFRKVAARLNYEWK